MKHQKISNEELSRQIANAPFKEAADLYDRLYHYVTLRGTVQQSIRLALLTMSCEAMIQEAA